MPASLGYLMRSCGQRVQSESDTGISRKGRRRRLGVERGIDSSFRWSPIRSRATPRACGFALFGQIATGDVGASLFRA